MQRVIKKLKEKNKTISTMESCTGGGIANEITNIEGASEVFKFSAVTYSNEYKIKMGVDSKVIENYTVYSMETAMEMSKNISKFANSNIGIGVTGKLNKPDNNNKYGDDGKVFVSIYNKDGDKFNKFEIKVLEDANRKENKKYIIDKIVEELLMILD